MAVNIDFGDDAVTEGQDLAPLLQQLFDLFGERGQDLGMPGGMPFFGMGDKAVAPAANAASGVLPSTPITGSMVGLPTAGGAGAASTATGAGMKGLLGKIFGKNGIDPTAALMMGLSLFGDDGGQERNSFRSPGQITDPMQALNQALQATYRLGQGLSERGPTRLRSSFVPPPPGPVSIPGLPFQIGGGLGRDPALDDPSLLMGNAQEAFKYDPFQSMPQTTFGFGSSSGSQGSSQKKPVRRRDGGS